ncbi:MAG: MFS transporter [Chloroflexi bacterium]|nr:MAG: hypothetical protein CUN54_02725 [Phototrophicales bacterium]RMF80885.1 MAG: MFS transporter [Chloroflexota bacterium]
MNTIREYPAKFWLLFGGTFINRAATSLIWPFLTIFMKQQLEVALTTITLLFTIRSIAGFVSSSVVSPVMDRVGRKWVMVISTVAMGLILIAMANLTSLMAWAVLIGLYGAVSPMFQVGSSTMVADIIEDNDKRPEAYALIRMITNAGIAIGPAIGGLLIAVSFVMTYYVAAGVLLILAVLTIIYLPETLPQQANEDATAQSSSGSYREVLRDHLFTAMVGVYILALMAYGLMFILLPVYAVENFAIEEGQTGLIIMVNALMVVLLQYKMTQFTKRFRPLQMMALGTLLYAIGVGSVAWGRSLPAFMLSMVVVTTGELIINPTAMALAAELAPVKMRARYMGVFTLSFTIAAGIGPVIGGYLNDHIAPVAIWYGGAFIAALAASGFLVLARMRLADDAPSATVRPVTSSLAVNKRV